jgi:hypothetical protein
MEAREGAPLFMVTDATRGNIISSASRRGLIERKPGDWKFRAIATRYDKLTKNFFAAVQLISVIILLLQGVLCAQHSNRRT